MSLLTAARLNDPIAHTSMFAMIGKIGAGLLVGAVVGAAVGFMATALVAGTILSGGLVGAVAVTLISGLIMHATGAPKVISAVTDALGNAIDAMFPPTVEGHIAQGSPNVFTNSRNAARAVADGADNTDKATATPARRSARATRR